MSIVRSCRTEVPLKSEVRRVICICRSNKVKEEQVSSHKLKVRRSLCSNFDGFGRRSVGLSIERSFYEMVQTEKFREEIEGQLTRYIRRFGLL